MGCESKERQAIRDRERILAFFMQRLHYDAVLQKNDLFEPYGTEAMPGDLVFLQSAPPTIWQLSWFVDRTGYSDCVLRAIGTGQLCNWSNVSWRVVSRSWTSHEVFLEGWQRRAWETAMKGLKACDVYFYRPRDVRFEKADMILTIGPHVWLHDLYQPFEVRIERADKLSIKRAKDELLAGGVGERFETRDGAAQDGAPLCK